MEPRKLNLGQSTEVWIHGVDTQETNSVFKTDEILLEAPNWGLTDLLILNGAGYLWNLSLDGELNKIEIPDLPDLNNDHVLDPDGEHIYLSANDWNIYRSKISGGPAELVTGNPDIPGLMHFLHGVSPDGETLAFIGLEPEGENWWAHANVFTVSKTGDNYKKLTTGTVPYDGSEFDPEGNWLYLNTEQFDGHSQIGRMTPDGTSLEQLTFDDNVNWFPHISPDGKYASYISFPPGTLGHPENVWVEIKLVSIPHWEKPTTVCRIFGGQGSLNVNSWSPDSQFFAFVSYPEESK